MTIDQELRDKLRKIEALYAGAKTDGERAAAGAAAERISARLAETSLKEIPIEMRFSLPDPWGRQLFIALCRRYGLKPYRYPRMKRQTVIVKAPRSFLDSTLWPEFQAANQALNSFLGDMTRRVIEEEVHGGPQDAEEVPEPKSLA